MYRIVLLRHGQSEWNLTNQFAGWVDVDLTPEGLQEASDAGELLQREGFSFDLGFASALRRSEKTLHTLLDRMNLLWIPVETTWRLNERHYGALQGLVKEEVYARFGRDQYKRWRRSYDVPPPPLPEASPWSVSNDRRYASIAASDRPVSECLQDCVARILPYWSVVTLPQVLAGRRLVVCAHGSTLRSLLKHFRGLSDEEIVDVDVPNGVPLVVELDSRGRYLRDEYLGDRSAIQAKIDAVAIQGTQKNGGKTGSLG